MGTVKANTTQFKSFEFVFLVAGLFILLLRIKCLGHIHSGETWKDQWPYFKVPHKFSTRGTQDIIKSRNEKRRIRNDFT
jgi:hypothetical protein